MMRIFLILALPLLFLSYAPTLQGQVISITGVQAFDDGTLSADGAGEIALDTVQEVCDTVDDQDILEPFADTVMRVDIQNSSLQDAHFTKMRYVIRKAGGKKVFRSSRVAPSGTPLVAAESPGHLFFLFLRAANAQKFFAGSKTAIDPSLGFRNVRIILKGKLSDGTRFRRKIRTGFHFTNVARCF